MVKNIILVTNEYEIQIRHAKNTPMAWVLRWKVPRWSPTPTRSVILYFRGVVLCFRYSWYVAPPGLGTQCGYFELMALEGGSSGNKH